MDKTTLYLTPELRRRLRETARRSGRRQADVIRSALDAYVDDGRANRPTSIGAGEDNALDAGDTETWLREHWRERPVIACAERNGGRVITFDLRDFGVVAAEGTITILPA